VTRAHRADQTSVIIVLNGPLGVGKSTLAEALAESIDSCVMLDGDALIAANPPAIDAREHLHSTIALLVAHHRRFGYHHFVIDHIWTSPADLADLRRRLEPDGQVYCFLLTLPLEENLRRIGRRAGARAIDERDSELRTLDEERRALDSVDGLGEPFDVTEAPERLVALLKARLPCVS
jgi:chloramphenicol 3-O-phosphotransferase